MTRMPMSEFLKAFEILKANYKPMPKTMTYYILEDGTPVSEADFKAMRKT